MNKKPDPHLEREFSLKRKQLNVSIFDTLGRALIAVLAAVIGVWQFTSQQKEAKTLEFRRELFRRKSTVFEHTCKAVAGVTSSAGTFVNKPKEYEQYSHEFMQIFRGEIPFIADSMVQVKCQDFYHDLVLFDILISHDLQNFDINNPQHHDKLSELRQTGDSVIIQCQRSYEELNNKLSK